MRKISALILIILTLFALILTGCKDGSGSNGTDTGTDEPVVDTQHILADFVLVRLDNCSKELSNKVVELASALSEKLGKTVSPETDFVAKDEKIPNGRAEILVGETNRDASRDALSSVKEYRKNNANDFIIRIKNQKIVIAAPSDEGTVLAIDHFIEKVLPTLSTTELLSDFEYTERKEYPALNLGESSIVDYSILLPKDPDKSLTSKITQLNKKVKEIVGYEIPTVTEPTGKDIVLNCGVGFNPKMARMSFDGDSLVIEAGSNTGVTKIFEHFISLLAPDATVSSDYRKTMMITVNAKFSGEVYGEDGRVKDAISFKTGETAKFVVKLLEGTSMVSCDRFSYTVMGDGIKTQRGTVSGENGFVEFDVTLDKPGFAYVYVSALDKNDRPIEDYTPFNGGAGFSVTEIKQTYSEPEDFDEVWAELVGRLDKISTKPTVMKQFASGEKNPLGGNYPKYDDTKYVAYDITIPCVSGVNPVRAILTMPKDKVGVKGSLNIKVGFYGYGVETASPACVPGTATLQVNIHGIDNGREDAYYTNFRNAHPAWAQNDGDKTKIEDYYFYGVMLRDIQAVKYLFTLPEYNGKGVDISGGSMGAMQSVTVASVISRGFVKGTIKTLNISVPWGADMGKVQTANGAHLMDYNIDNADDSRIPRYWGINAYKEDTLYNYFDIANHIKGVTGPIIISGCLGDYVSPPRSVMVLYNNAELASSVKLTMQQNATHGGAGAGSKNFTMSK